MDDLLLFSYNNEFSQKSVYWDYAEYELEVKIKKQSVAKMLI